jgi:hypothetical protein
MHAGMKLIFRAGPKDIVNHPLKHEQVKKEEKSIKLVTAQHQRLEKNINQKPPEQNGD